MGRKLTRGPRKKPLHIAAKKLALQRIGKKRLSPTKAQREALRNTIDAKLGYETARLSRQVAKPSRYTTKGKRLVVDTDGRILREEFIVKRVHKSGGTGKGRSSRGEGPVRYGSAAAVRQMIKKTKHKRMGKKGKRTGKEKRKK